MLKNCVLIAAMLALSGCILVPADGGPGRGGGDCDHRDCGHRDGDNGDDHRRHRDDDNR